MTKISILGCGWLGLPLAKSLLEHGFSVNGSTTSLEKLSGLENLGIHAFLISLSAHQTEGDIVSFLENVEVLIIDIPPKLRGFEKENFVDKIEMLLPFIEESSVKKVLFISSTSVYADDDSVVSEETQPQPETESGKQLIQAEALLKHNKHFKTTILRFGGLIGEERHPIRFLAGRGNLDNPDAPINLIHQMDCIGIILKIIEKDYWNETLNAVAPVHPSRETYYKQKAIDLNLALPEFIHNKPSVGKTVLSKKIETNLEYQFKMREL